jgi:protein O-mannosyl-transferase
MSLLPRSLSQSRIAAPLLVIAALALLLSVTFLIYRPGLAGPFLLDDEIVLSETFVPTLSGPALRQMVLNGRHGFAASRALPNLTFAVTQYWSGPDATARLKQQNLLLHLINGLLVFWLVWLLARQPATRPERTAVPADPPLDPPTLAAAGFALAVASVWLLHPLQVSTVLYISQRYVLLAALFMLAALISYVKGRTLMRTQPVAGTALALIGSGGFGLLAMISKEIAALLPLLIAAIEWCVFSRTTGRAERLARRITMLGLVAVPLVALALYFGPRLHWMLGWNPGRGFSGLERLMTEAHVLALYLKLYFVPIPGSMSLFHDTFPLTRQMDAATWALALGYGAAIVAAIVLHRRAPWVALGSLWFFACHLLESTVLALELVFEHRNYLAILGLTLALLGGVGQLLRRVELQRLAVPTLAAFVLLVGLNTAVRAADWSDMERLLASEYRRDPQSPRVLLELIKLAGAQGDRVGAAEWLDHLLALDRENATAELLALQLYCNRETANEGLYEGALEKLTTGILPPSTVASLGYLVREWVNGRCPALTRHQVMLMTEHARANPRVPGASIGCAVDEVHMVLLIKMKNWSSVADLLHETIHKCADHSPMRIKYSVDTLVIFGLSTGQPDAVRAILSGLINEANLKDKLDSAYGGHGIMQIKQIVKQISIHGSEDASD